MNNLCKKFDYTRLGAKEVCLYFIDKQNQAESPKGWSGEECVRAGTEGVSQVLLEY